MYNMPAFYFNANKSTTMYLRVIEIQVGPHPHSDVFLEVCFFNMPVCKNESKFQNTALLLGGIQIRINFYAQKYLKNILLKIPVKIDSSFSSTIYTLGPTYRFSALLCI